MKENNTAQSFSDKWHLNSELAFSQTADENSSIYKWISKRNGFTSQESWRTYLSNKKRILDAGCGNGRVTALLRSLTDPNSTEVVGIDLTAADVARKNLEQFENLHCYSRNLLDDLKNLGNFDFIYCQEVLHHTGNPRKGFDNLVQILAPGGEIAIYVYKKKAPAREYLDDYIRDKIGGMPYEEAMKHCRQITQLGKSLHDAKIKVKIPEIEILEIPEGEYDLQRFIYHFFAKIFWNDEFEFEENAVINYDWYHPQNCTRHTHDEIQHWFLDNDLEIIHEFVDFYGITVRGIKK